MIQVKIGKEKENINKIVAKETGNDTVPSPAHENFGAKIPSGGISNNDSKQKSSISNAKPAGNSLANKVYVETTMIKLETKLINWKLSGPKIFSDKMAEGVPGVKGIRRNYYFCIIKAALIKAFF